MTSWKSQTFIFVGEPDGTPRIDPEGNVIACRLNSNDWSVNWRPRITLDNDLVLVCICPIPDEIKRNLPYDETGALDFKALNAFVQQTIGVVTGGAPEDVFTRIKGAQTVNASH